MCRRVTADVTSVDLARSCQTNAQLKNPNIVNVVLDVIFVSTASGALVVGGVRDICMYPSQSPEIALSVQWSRTNQSVAVCGSL